MALHARTLMVDTCCIILTYAVGLEGRASLTTWGIVLEAQAVQRSDAVVRRATDTEGPPVALQ